MVNDVSNNLSYLVLPSMLPGQSNATNAAIITPQVTSNFEQLLASSLADMPATTGPAFYAARRALWLTPPPNAVPKQPVVSTSRRRLAKLLHTPNAVQNETIWRSDIQKIWQGLNSGAQLKRSVPLELVVRRTCSSCAVPLRLFQIKIVQSAWIRDNTWPSGAVAPADSEPDTAAAKVQSG